MAAKGSVWGIQGRYRWAAIGLLIAAAAVPIVVWVLGGTGMAYLRALAMAGGALALIAAFMRLEAHGTDPDLDLLGKAVGFYAAILAALFAIFLMQIELVIPSTS